MQRVIYICESEQRWHRTVARFADQLLPSGDDTLAIHRLGLAQALATSKTLVRSDVMLWELSAAHFKDIIVAIDRLSMRRNSPLQLAALPPDFVSTSAARADIHAHVRQSDLLAVLEQPLDLVRCSAALRRHWQRATRQDNLAAAQAIWKRLPWAQQQT